MLCALRGKSLGAATFEFLAGTAGALGIAAGFRSAADRGRCARLCMNLRWRGTHNGGLGAEFQDLTVYGFHLGFYGGEAVGLEAAGRRVGISGNFEDGERGAEADGRRDLRVIKDFVNDLAGAGGTLDSVFVPGSGLFADGKFHFVREGGNSTTPVADGVAVNGGGRGGFSKRVALDDEVEDVVLGGGEGVIG